LIANKDQVYQSLDQRYVEWIHAGGTDVDQKWGLFKTGVERSDAYSNFHGTSVLSKAVNEPLGIGRDVAVTIVRVPEPILDDYEKEHKIEVQFRWSCIEHALQLIHKDVKEKMERPGDGPNPANMRSVVNLSFSADLRLPSKWDGKDMSGMIPQGPKDKYWKTRVWLTRLSLLGVTVTACTGNQAKSTEPESYILQGLPAIWSGQMFPIIVSKTVTKMEILSQVT
jgi:hypothetical protein